MEQQHQNPIPHILIFPFPGQGQVNSMLKLAELLCLAGQFQVTFLNSYYNHERLFSFNPEIQQRFSTTRFPGFRFETISDGLPSDHPRSGDHFNDIFNSIQTITKPLFRQLLISSSSSSQPVTCVIADGLMTFTIDVAQEEFGIPVICFRTISACCIWSYFCVPKLIESSELPFKDDDDMDGEITCLPGMGSSMLRCRDLPSFCRTKDLFDPIFQGVLTETLNSARASGGLILNTFEDIEGPVLSQIRNHCFKLYTIGPLHALLRRLNSRNDNNNGSSSSTSLWKQDMSCITWLDSQSSNSVVYISFGSLTVLSRDQMLELWHGVVNSGKPFLWVMRPDSIERKREDHEHQTLSEEEEQQLMNISKERGYIVRWAPQEEVLRHRAIGGFLTHSGWNSTMESLVEGVPMLCWPYFADQQINSRFVSQVWRVGLDMKDSCKREIVEKMVRDLMEEEKTGKELSKKAKSIAELANRSIEENGSSNRNLDRLIEDIRFMKMMGIVNGDLVTTIPVRPGRWNLPTDAAFVYW